MWKVLQNPLDGTGVAHKWISVCQLVSNISSKGYIQGYQNGQVQELVQIHYYTSA